jgi:hypothetical protein
MVSSASLICDLFRCSGIYTCIHILEILVPLGPGLRGSVMEILMEIHGGSMSSCQIAVIVGSLRRDSCNRRLADALVTQAPSEFSFSRVEIGDLPLYNQDDDEDPAA